MARNLSRSKINFAGVELLDQFVEDDLDTDIQVKQHKLITFWKPIFYHDVSFRGLYFPKHNQ